MALECIVEFVVDNTGNTTRGSEDCQIAVLEGFQDQSLSIFNLSNQWIALVLAFLIGCCVAMNMTGKIFIMWHVMFQSLKRPLNALILIDQGVQLLPVLVNGICTSVSLILKKPLVHYIGRQGCLVLSMFPLAKNLSLMVGSAGMAVYRLSIYKFAHRISDCKAIRKTILLVEMITFLALFSTFFYKFSVTQSGASLNFWLGQTSVISETISHGGDQESIQFVKELRTFGLILAQSIILLEGTCYVILYLWKKRDNLGTTPMSKKLAKRRNQRNTITLSGQIIGFAIETAYTVLLLILTKATESQILREYMPIYANFVWLVITMTQIVTSEELRGFLLGRD